MKSKLKCSVLGATGMVGQKFVELLSNHPWFEVANVAASDRSDGKRYADAARWVLNSSVPPELTNLTVTTCDPKAVGDVDVVFSALPADVAKSTEEDFARAGYAVLSNASSHRMAPDVPLLNPEINADHVVLIEEQRRRRKWDGAIVTNPNCTTAVLTMPLKPIMDHFGIAVVIMTSMQALSGAGYPGVASLDIVDNVLPYIRNEEEKVQIETVKILGSCEKAAAFNVSASCNRVATLDGHLETVFVQTEKPATPTDVAEAMKAFEGEPQKLKLPSAPFPPIVVRSEDDRPQPRLDRMAGGGMAVTVGRIRPDPGLGGVKFLVLGHNTIRGAAGCSIINAEVLKTKGYV
ncbi:MAG: aspartate-semialdehyde dehydrogenase [Candidatus Bathyarchaeia archaeon]